MANEFEHKVNNGSLWTEKSKKSANSPDVKGKLKVKISDIDIVNENGEEVAILKISGWRKKTKTGDTFLSISLNTYKGDENGNNDRKQTASQGSNSDSDVPF